MDSTLCITCQKVFVNSPIHDFNGMVEWNVGIHGESCVNHQTEKLIIDYSHFSRDGKAEEVCKSTIFLATAQNSGDKLLIKRRRTRLDMPAEYEIIAWGEQAVSAYYSSALELCRESGLTSGNKHSPENIKQKKQPEDITPKKMKFAITKSATIHFRRIGVIVLNSLFGNMLVFALIGFVNKHILNRPIKSIFMLYPANEKYTHAYVYPWYARRMKWKPCLVGILKQSGKTGLIFGISAIEEDFINPENISHLKMVEAKLERIRKTTGADQKTFAGILPSVLFSKGLINVSREREVTVRALLQALDKIKSAEKLPCNVPVLILGGSGFIGSALKKAGNGDFHSFDIGEGERFHATAEKLKGNPAILLNLTKKGTLKSYIPFLWPKIVVLNEVYPEPSEKELAAINAKGACCYHIIGVKGSAWPTFPGGYAGGIPCCASFYPDDGRGYEVLIKKM